MSTTVQLSLPTDSERRRMQPYEASRRVRQAYRDAQEELHRRGQRASIKDASSLLGQNDSTTYYSAMLHCIAVEIWGISPDLGKQKAITRLKELDPSVTQLARQAEAIGDVRDDLDLLADAVSALLKAVTQRLLQFETGKLAAQIGRYPSQRGSTKSTLKDLIGWLTDLEKAL